MRFLICAWIFAGLTAAQFPPSHPIPKPDREKEVRLPNGKLQSEEILKEEHAKSLKEAGEMKELIGEFYDELKKSGRNVVSVQVIKKLEEIEKRAKRIRGRLTRY